MKQNTSGDEKDRWEQFRVALRRLPTLASACRDLTDNSDTYRVIASKENIHLFREGSDGFARAILRGSNGKIQEHAKFLKVPPNAWGGVAATGMQATVAELAEKLDYIIEGIEGLDQLIRATNGGKVKGCLDALETQRYLEDIAERRIFSLQACMALQAEIGVIAEQLIIDVEAMPVASGSFWGHVAKNQVRAAKISWGKVHKDCALIASTTKALLETHAELENYAAAEKAFSQITDRVLPALHRAEERARLLPYNQGSKAPPELQLRRAIEGFEATRFYLKCIKEDTIPLDLLISYSETRND